MSGSLEGKTAVVTGGTRGIGFAIAERFADAGATVVVTSRSSTSCQEAAAALGAGHRGLPCDVTDESQLSALFASIPQVDIFVHCAGVSSAGSSLTVKRETLQHQHAVHFLGGVQGAQLAAAKMKDAGGGAILLVVSVWGLGGQPQTLAYGSAKAALAHSVKVLGVEWARYGIRVNGLAPGFVATDMTKDLGDKVLDKLLSKVPMRRAATPSEMAGPALFLCSDDASYVTGHVLVADGGERAR